jgi:hypothetical protein
VVLWSVVVGLDINSVVVSSSVVNRSDVMPNNSVLQQWRGEVGNGVMAYSGVVVISGWVVSKVWWLPRVRCSMVVERSAVVRSPAVEGGSMGVLWSAAVGESAVLEWYAVMWSSAAAWWPAWWPAWNDVYKRNNC